ncbi:MAG: Cas9 inhibitor AcrIIA9 family protein, partial [Christensenellales bacterium]
MITLNLKTETKEQEILKDYLENNVSEVLADKINNGVKIIKDNKTLLNKKSLSDFMKYACEEARKLAEKGLNYACIEDKVVFGWAIHYFEEDSIEGNLYNEDGTEYKVEIKTTTPKVEVKQQPK